MTKNLIPLIEQHPLTPFLPQHATLLMLGSFPPPKARWNMNFYYPNFQNDMWRIFGLVFFQDKNYFIDLEHKMFKEQLIREFLNQKGIAIYDTAEKVQRLADNASDKFLNIIQPTNIIALLQNLPNCQYIMATGDKATETLISVLPENTKKPMIGQSTIARIEQRQLQLYRMPSSSRAYPLALEKKAEQYRIFFQKIGLQ